MSAVDDVDEALEQYHLAAEEFIKGNPEPYKDVFSHREDVTLANPYGPPVRGWEHVSEALEHTASRLREGEVVGVETVTKCVTSELAYVVSVAREKAKVGGSEEITPISAAHDDDPQARRGQLEGRASARGPHNHASASRVGHSGVGLPLERTSQNAVNAKFGRLRSDGRGFLWWLRRYESQHLATRRRNGCNLLGAFRPRRGAAMPLSRARSRSW